MAGFRSEGVREDGFLIQVLPVLALLAVGSLLTGVVFQRMTPFLKEFPGLIVLVPPLIGLRGNINTSMGARLGSALHMGLVDPSDPRDPVVRANVGGSLALSAIMPGLAGVIAWAASLALGLDAMPLSTFVLVAVVAGIVSGVLLAAATLGILLAAHRRGLDPDNVTGPALATVGDVVTLAVLYATAAAFAGGIG